MTDAEIIAELHAAVAAERRSTKRVLLALMPFDERALALANGYASTFEYCVKALGYPGHAAYKRINVARLARSKPEILEKIDKGVISLSAVAAIYPHVKTAAGQELLREAEGKNCREVEAMIAKLSPLPDAPKDTVTALALLPQPGAAEPQLAYRVSITLSDEGYEKLKRATDLLRHKHPRGEPHAIVEDALEALLDSVDRSRKERPSRPRTGASAPAPGSRHIPEWVKDHVWRRDGGQCAFISRDGRRCEARSFLQYDHATPFALGGASDDPGNVRLLCAAHNRLAALDAGLARPEAPAVDSAPRGE